MSLRQKIIEATPPISQEEIDRAYNERLKQSERQAIDGLDRDRQMIAVLNSVPQKGFHRWAYEIVALSDAGIYKGSRNQVADARKLIAEWEGKAEERKAA